MKRSGFTLIELLVVIAIIGLLITILIPSLSRARQSGRRVNCASNQRSLMQAVVQYANNNRDKIVGAGLSHGGSGNEHAAWINTLKKYYGENEGIARCPADWSEHWDKPIMPPQPANTNVGNPNQSIPEPILRRTSYGTNYYTVARVGDAGPYNKLSMIRRPATTIHMAELAEDGAFATSDHVHPETWWSNPQVLAAEEMKLDRHLKKSNYAFFDGHVESHEFSDIYAINQNQSTFRNIVWSHNFFDPAIAR